MKYTVHLYPIVRVTVPDIEAESQREAMEKADSMVDMVDMHMVFDNIKPGGVIAKVEFAECDDGYFVDEDGDTDYEHSRWYDQYYCPL